jgi:hypothetical protein
MFTRDELIYLAGYLDGDGYFFIGKFKTKKGNDHFHTIINISSINKEIIEWVKQKFGCSSWSQTRHRVGKIRKNASIVYQVNVTGDKLTNILEKIIPFLRIKKAHAEIMLRMRQTYRRNKTRGAAPVSDEDNLIRQECFESIRKINSRFTDHPMKSS